MSERPDRHAQMQAARLLAERLEREELSNQEHPRGLTNEPQRILSREPLDSPIQKINNSVMVSHHSQLHQSWILAIERISRKRLLLPVMPTNR